MRNSRLQVALPVSELADQLQTLPGLSTALHQCEGAVRLRLRSIDAVFVVFFFLRCVYTLIRIPVYANAIPPRSSWSSCFKKNHSHNVAQTHRVNPGNAQNHRPTHLKAHPNTHLGLCHTYIFISFIIIFKTFYNPQFYRNIIYLFFAKIRFRSICVFSLETQYFCVFFFTGAETAKAAAHSSGRRTRRVDRRGTPTHPCSQELVFMCFFLSFPIYDHVMVLSSSQKCRCKNYSPSLELCAARKQREKLKSSPNPSKKSGKKFLIFFYGPLYVCGVNFLFHAVNATGLIFPSQRLSLHIHTVVSDLNFVPTPLFSELQSFQFVNEMVAGFEIRFFSIHPSNKRGIWTTWNISRPSPPLSLGSGFTSRSCCHMNSIFQENASLVQMWKSLW